jgi:hypothetical protein
MPWSESLHHSDDVLLEFPQSTDEAAAECADWDLVAAPCASVAAARSASGASHGVPPLG